MVILTALFASLVASALLAWYFSRPIRHLRWALSEIAEGRFDIRVQQLMDGRRDELADLGRDVDSTAHKLDQLMKAQRRLLHDVSHELRSPLARIQAALGLGRQDLTRCEATFDRVERETMRLDELVGQLLALSRLEADSGNEPWIDIDVVELLADLVQDAQFEAGVAGKTVLFESDEKFVLRCREESMRRAMENVLRNAVKYTGSGTAVNITVIRPTAKCLTISVCDRGPGVPPSQLEAIFEPFYRVPGNSEKGFGLGLAMARCAIETHGGSIRAENRVGGGLCLHIELSQP